MMEIWFYSAILGMLFAGISNFAFKIAASRNYNSEVFSIYSAAASVVVLLPLALAIGSISLIDNALFVLAFAAGFFAAFSGIAKVYALRYIDTTIYFPLFKVLTPLLSIILGIMLFKETFSFLEWFGLVLGLLVPLLLITKTENRRQVNLKLGLLLVVFTGCISAGVAGVNKYITGIWNDVTWILVASSLGVLLGSLFAVWYKKGLRDLWQHICSDSTIGLAVIASLRGILISTSFGFILYAYVTGGSLAIVQTIQSMYILIPIVLAIVLYKEHWNTQKVFAIILSVVALLFLQ